MELDNIETDSLTIRSDKSETTDYSSICDEQIPLAEKLSKFHDHFDEAMELLYQLEKMTRGGGDTISCTRVLLTMVEICVQRSNWDKLQECILIVTKRRNILKDAITKMIQICMGSLDKCPTKDVQLKMIETLRSVTEGKIYVEIERARLTKMLSDIKENDGDVSGAATLMGELKVETYGSMDKREKTQLLLEQMRLYALNQDYRLAQILSKKISSKFLDEPEQEDLKKKFYNLKIILDRSSSFLDTSRHYQAISNCSSVPDDEKEKLIKNAVIYCLLAPYDNEQENMKQNLLKDKFIEKNPLLKTLLEIFITKEIIVPDLFNREFRERLYQLEVLNEKTPHGRKCWNELKDRLIEHNILVISTWYTRIYLTRMSELIYIPSDQCEEHLSKLANSGGISVKIDRSLGIVNFTKRKQPADILNDWSSNVNDFMSLVNKTCHLINKEICMECARTNGKD